MTLVYNPGGNGYIFKSLDVIDLDFGLDYFFRGYFILCFNSSGAHFNFSDLHICCSTIILFTQYVMKM